MTLEEIRKIKEDLSKQLYGKTAEEINEIIEPGAQRTRRRIEELRKQKETNHTPE